MNDNVKILEGNIFTSRLQTIVNTVNCVGVMGAGIAFECRRRYPDMYTKYVHLCQQELLTIGKLWLYKGADRWILNFPTKTDWKLPSKLAYIEKGLAKFVATYEEKGITSAAFPVLGAQNGGLNISESVQTMSKYLQDCRIPIEIYKYSPSATDDSFLIFKNLVQQLDDLELSRKTGVSKSRIQILRSALADTNICQVNQLIKVNKIGSKTLEKVFAATMKPCDGLPLSQTGEVN
jgi:O-acetyl-ADP-ribose deacetylase (regulator of RNase III)